MNLFQIVMKVVITTIDLILLGSCVLYADEPKVKKFLVVLIMMNVMGVWV